MNGSSSRTNIETNQTADLITGSGQMIGVAITNLQGNVFLRGEPTEPPNLDSVCAYLQQVMDEVRTPEIAVQSPALEKVWKLPFRAHAPGQSTPTGILLPDAVHEVFSRDRALGRGERVVILAERGMGKTPSLFHLRAERAGDSWKVCRDDPENVTMRVDDRAPEDKACVVPLLIDLADLNSGLSLYALLQNTFNRYVRPDLGEDVRPISLGQVPDLLNSYRCLILMDNLDALISNRGSNGVLLVRMLMDVHHEHQYVLACRTASYREQLGPLNTLYLDELTPEDVCQVLGQEDCRRLAGSMQALACNRGMLSLILRTREQAESPQRTEQALAGLTTDPLSLDNKGQLLRLHMTQQLHEHYKEEYPALSLLVGVLEHLAYTMHHKHTLLLDEQQVMTIFRAYLESWYETVHWREVLNALDEGEMGLLQRDNQKLAWRFCDRSDQAYFTATAIMAHPERLAPVLQEVDDYWWREMFEILVGLIPDPAALFFRLIDTAPLVAANCLQYTGKSVHERVTGAVIDALVEHMELESSSRRKFIVERIGESNHPGAGEALFLVFHKEWSSLVLKAIARGLAQWACREENRLVALKESEEKALRLRRDDGTRVAEVVACYAEALLPEKETQTPAERGATDGPDIMDRGMRAPRETTEVRRKLQGWLEDPREPARKRALAALYLGLLACRATEDAAWAPLPALFQPESEGGCPQLDSRVAWCVTEALTDSALTGVEEAAVNLLQKEDYCPDEWRDYRARALYLLGWVSNQSSTGELLSQALKDEDPLIRCFAIDATTRLGLPGTRERLQEMLAPEKEKDPEVLRRIAEALGQIGTADSIPLLDRYRHHERTRTRWMMKRAIAEIRARYSL
jgi:hypothetical protein